MNQKENAMLKKLYAELDALDPEELDDDPIACAKLNQTKWTTYQCIVKTLKNLAGNSTCVENLHYAQYPCNRENEASATVTLSQLAMFDGIQKTVLSDVIRLCDRWSLTTLNNTIRLSFVVDHIWS